MDLNYLYHRHQVALFRAETAACAEARLAHQAMADAYGRLIGEARLDSEEG